jgi:hypothetical protein
MSPCTVSGTSWALLKRNEIVPNLSVIKLTGYEINTLNVELNPTCHLLALLGAHPTLHVRKIWVKLYADKSKAVDITIQ